MTIENRDNIKNYDDLIKKLTDVKSEKSKRDIVTNHLYNLSERQVNSLLDRAKFEDSSSKNTEIFSTLIAAIIAYLVGLYGKSVLQGSLMERLILNFLFMGIVLSPVLYFILLEKNDHKLIIRCIYNHKFENENNCNKEIMNNSTSYYVSENLNDLSSKVSFNMNSKAIAKINTSKFSIIIFDSINKSQLNDLISTVETNVN